MNEAIRLYVETYPTEIKELFNTLRALVYQSVPYNVEEKMWAKLPSYYVGASFVRLIPFKDHINIEAAGVLFFRGELGGYKITPKGMLQIHAGQAVPADTLKQIFGRTFAELAPHSPR